MMCYWQECISEAFDEAELVATKEQIETVASLVKGAHETHGEVLGPICIPNPGPSEFELLRRDLVRERNKIVCSLCRGLRGIDYMGRPLGHDLGRQCPECKGEGKTEMW